MILKPIIILGAPRSGTTILHRCLALHPSIWHLASESHAVLEGPFHPKQKGYESNRVVADDLSEELADGLRSQFYRLAINLNKVWATPAPLLAANTLPTRAFCKLAVNAVGKLSQLKKPKVIRFLEKTPKNTLRIPMMSRLFPDALFVWLRRSAANNIDSLITGWYATDKIGPISRERYARAGYPVTHRLKLADYRGKWWKFALVPGWQNLKGKTIADVAAWQYYQCNSYVLKDLPSTDSRRVFSVQYEDFVRTPAEVLGQICEWADLAPSGIVRTFANDLPRVNEAIPNAFRSSDGLRHAGAVGRATERLPQLRSLEHLMANFSHGRALKL
jgi:hypothetical protein